MAVQTIENIINYNPEEMEQKLILAKESYEKDDELKRLKREVKTEEYFFSVVYVCILIMFFGFVCITPICLKSLGCSEFITIVISILVLAILVYLFFVELPANMDVIFEEKKLKQFNGLYASYFPDKLLFHEQIYNRNILVCYGEPVEYSKFKITVITEATDVDERNRVEGLDKNTVKRSYTFDFNGSNPSGVLTLDVSNGRVFYA